jgi:hypothetical protein
MNETKATVRETINHQPSGGKAWAAELIGRDPKYTFTREFLNPVDTNRSSSGKTGSNTYELEDGKLYQLKPSWKDKYFATVRDGKLVEVTVKEALAIVDAMEADNV